MTGSNQAVRAAPQRLSSGVVTTCQIQLLAFLFCRIELLIVKCLLQHRMAPLRFLIVIALAVIVNTAICLSKPASVPGLKSLRTGKLYGSLSCKACEAAVFTVRELLKLHVSEDTIAKRLLGICELFKIEKEAVCIGAISEFKVCNVKIINRMAIQRYLKFKWDLLVSGQIGWSNCKRPRPDSVGRIYAPERV